LVTNDLKIDKQPAFAAGAGQSVPEVMRTHKTRVQTCGIND
jgi:hypothetical protein